MRDRSVEAIVASPPERDDLVVQLFVKDGGQWGEVIRENDAYILELYQQNGPEVRQISVEALTSEVLRPVMQSLGWSIDIDEALHVVKLAVQELAARQS